MACVTKGCSKDQKSGVYRPPYADLPKWLIYQEEINIMVMSKPLVGKSAEEIINGRLALSLLTWPNTHSCIIGFCHGNWNTYIQHFISQLSKPSIRRNLIAIPSKEHTCTIAHCWHKLPAQKK